MVRLFAMLLCCVPLLAGGSPAGKPVHGGKPVPPATREQCTARGGKWILYPMGQFHFCALDTTDRGKPCADDSECQGDCVPARHQGRLPGVCAPTLPMPGGCPVHVVKGKVVEDPCI